MTRRALAAAAVLVLLPVAASGQDRPDVGITVTAARWWFDASKPLALDLGVENRGSDPLTDARVTVSLHERVRTRSDLRRAYEGRVSRSPLQAFNYRVPDIPPGGIERISVTRPPEELTAFEEAPAGVYPLTVTVRKLTGPAIDSVTTAVAYLTDRPQTATAVLPVLVVAPEPILRPDGSPERDTREVLTAWRRRLTPLAEPAVRYALAISPVLLDELRALRGTDLRAAGAELEQAVAAAAAGADVVALPYAYADLTTLPDGPDIERQLRLGRASVRRTFGSDPRPVLFPPGLKLDPDTIDAAREADVEVVLAPGTVTSPASGGLTSADPVRSSGMLLLPMDEQLTQTASGAQSDLELGRLMAETAMVYFESPARQRAMALTVVAGTRPTRFADLLTQMRDAPWMRPVDASALDDIPARSLRVRSASGERPARAYTEALSDARAAVERLEAVTLPENPFAGHLRASLDTALGTAWWMDEPRRGVAWVSGISAAVRRLQSQVSTSPPAPITFTSRRGEVPITVVNRTGYPVRISVSVSSPKLKFPDGDRQVLEPLQPPGATVTFAALTEATGTFPLKVRLESPDGAFVVHEQEIVVRSTTYNVVALVITLAAALFVVGWYGRRFVRR